MKKLKTLFLIVIFSALSGCVAPLSSNFVGRSLGKGKFGLDAGGVILDGGGSYTFKLAYGMTSNIDLGLQSDFFSAGVFGKYSFMNPTGNGLAMAALFGGGAAGKGTYGYAGPVLSYKTKFVEPYFVGRYNFVQYDETKDVLFGQDISAGSYSYFQFTFGSVFWMTKKIGLNFEINTFSGETGLSSLKKPVIAGGVRFKF